MEILHQFTGYREQAGSFCFVLGHDIPTHLLEAVKSIVGVGPDDPDAIETYRLTSDQVALIQATIRCPEVVLSGVSYFLEAYLPVNT